MYSDIKDQDLKILNFIDEHECLSIRDINLFFDIKLITLRKRLNILCEYKLVSFLRVSNFSGFKYYFATQKGHKLLKTDTRRFNNRDIFSKKLFLNHIIEANAFFILLKEYSLKNGYVFSDWISDINTTVIFRYNGRVYKLIPDGFCIFGDNSIYLELDRSTETFFKILNKIEVYSNFYLSMEYKKYFDIFPKVIFIFPDSKRADFIEDKVKSYIALKKYSEELNFFYFFNKSDFYQDIGNYL